MYGVWICGCTGGGNRMRVMIMRACVYVCMCMCMCVFVCVFVWVSVRACVYMWVSVRVCVYMCMLACVFVCDRGRGEAPTSGSFSGRSGSGVVGHRGGERHSVFVESSSVHMHI